MSSPTLGFHLYPGGEGGRPEEEAVALPAAIPPALKVAGMAERTSVREGLPELVAMEVDEVEGPGRLWRTSSRPLAGHGK